MEIVALVGHVLPGELFNNVFDPRKTFPPLRRLTGSEFYPVASTHGGLASAGSGSATPRGSSSTAWPRRTMEFRGRIYSVPAKEFGR
jgi:hypothetical protein